MARTYEELKAEMAAKRSAAEAAKAAAPQVEPAPVAPASPFAVPDYLRPPAELMAPEGLEVFEPAPKAKKIRKLAAPATPSVTRAEAGVQPKPQEIFKTPGQVAEQAREPEIQTVPKAELTPDMRREVDWKKFYDSVGTEIYKPAKRRAAEALQLTEAQLEAIAQAQGVNLEAINEAKIKGRTYEEVARANRERGVLGFMPLAEREASFSRTVDDFEKAQRGEASEGIRLKKSGADQDWTGGYVAMGTREVLPEVSKPGEYGHLVSETLIGALQKDPKASAFYDLYGRKIATGNTQKYIEERTKDLMERAGVGPSDPDSFEKRQKLRRRAINEILAYKTIGMWTPAVTMQDVQVTEGVEAPGFFASIGPNIELIGLNNKGQAIYRQESPLGVLFRAIDIPQEAIVGKLEGRTAAEGIQTGANFLEYAMEHTEGDSPYVRYPALAAGFIGAVAMPDLLVGPGMAAKGVKAAKRFYDVRKIAPRVLELLTDVAEARKTKDMTKAKKAEVALRDYTPQVADMLDRYDAAAARRFQMVDPIDEDIFNEDVSALLATLDDEGAKALAAERVHLHPSMRKPETAAKLPTKEETYSSFDELFNTDILEARVSKAKADYIATAPRTVQEHFSRYAKGLTRSKLEAYKKAKVITQAELDDLARIVEASTAPALAGNMGQWKSALQATLKAHPVFGDPKLAPLRKAVYVNVGKSLESRAKSMAGLNIGDLNAADMAVFDRALTAISRNSEARGVAATLLHKEVADQAKIRVQPLELFDDVALKGPGGEAIRLTPGGVLFLTRIRNLLPEVPFKDVYAESVLIDKIVIARARKEGRDAFSIYEELFPEIRAATKSDIKRYKTMASGGGPSPAPVGGAPGPAPVGGAPVAGGAPVIGGTPGRAQLPTRGVAVTAGRARVPVRRQIPDTLDIDVTETLPSEEIRLPLFENLGEITEAAPIRRGERAATEFPPLFETDIEATRRAAGEPTGEVTREVTQRVGEATQEIPFRRRRAELARLAGPEAERLAAETRLAATRLAEEATAPGFVPLTAEQQRRLFQTEAEVEVLAARAPEVAALETRLAAGAQQEQAARRQLATAAGESDEAFDAALAAVDVIAAQNRALEAELDAARAAALGRGIPLSRGAPTPTAAVTITAGEEHPLTLRAYDYARRLAADPTGPNAPRTIIGRGGNADVFEIPGEPDLVARVVRRRDPATAVEGLVPSITPNPMGAANVGQPLARVGDTTILVRQKGFPAGMSNTDPAFKQANRDEIYADRIRAAAALPQEAYDQAARDLLLANERGLNWDPSKSNNVLIDPESGRFGLVDLSARAPGSSYRNTAGELVTALSGNTHAYSARELIPALEAPRRQIIEKAQAAAERTGLPLTRGGEVDSSFEYSKKLAGITETEAPVARVAEEVAVEPVIQRVSEPAVEVAVEPVIQRAPAAEEPLPAVRKAKGFRDKNSINAGVYEVDIGGKTRRFFRDSKEGFYPRSFVEDVPTSADVPVLPFLGDTIEDAVKALQRMHGAEEAPAAARAAEEVVAEAAPAVERAVEAAPVAKAEEAVSAAPTQPSSITPAAAAPVVAAETSRDLEKFLDAVKKLKTPKATEKFLADFQTAALTPSQKVRVYDSLATKLEKLAEAEEGDLVLETLAATARDAERSNRQAAETLLREGGGLRQTGPAGVTPAAEVPVVREEIVAPPAPPVKAEPTVDELQATVARLEPLRDAPIKRANVTKNGFTVELAGQQVRVEKRGDNWFTVTTGRNLGDNVTKATESLRAELVLKPLAQAQDALRKLGQAQSAAAAVSSLDDALASVKKLRTSKDATKFFDVVDLLPLDEAERLDVLVKFKDKLNDLAAKAKAAVVADKFDDLVTATDDAMKKLRPAAETAPSAVAAAADELTEAQRHAQAVTNIRSLTHRAQVDLGVRGNFLMFGGEQNGRFVPVYFMNFRASSPPKPSEILESVYDNARLSPQIQEAARRDAEALLEGQTPVVSAFPANKYANDADLKFGGLRQTGPAGVTKGVTELRADGRSIIILFEGADPTTVLHEVAHILRRNVLDTEDMNAITRWLTSRGINVSHQYGEFVGAPDEVEKAEEFFAKAFEQYALEGAAPTPLLQSAFDTLKQAVAQVYLGVSDPVIGVNLQPEVRRVFDGLVSTVDDQPNVTLKQVLRRELLGAEDDSAEGFLNVLSREASRKGMPRATLEDLQKQFDFGEGREFARLMIEKRVAELKETPAQAADAIRRAFGPSASTSAAKMTDRERGIMAAVSRPNAAPDPIRVSFPAPVLGKRDWSFDDLAEFQAARTTEREIDAARKKGIFLDLSGKGLGTASVVEKDAVEELRAYFAYNKDIDDVNKVRGKAKAVVRAVIATFFGGDVVAEKGGAQNLLRFAPPEFRQAVDAAERPISQGINDTIALVNDAIEVDKRTELYRYLGGVGDVRRVAGRPILSAGHDYMGSVIGMIRRSIDDLKPEEKAALETLAEAVNSPNRSAALVKLGFDPKSGNTLSDVDAAVVATREAASRAMSKLLFSTQDANADFGASLASAIRGAVEAPANIARPTHEMLLVENLTYISGLTQRNGALFTGTSQDAAKVLLEGDGVRKGVAQIYDEESARRMAVAIGGFGSSVVGKDTMVKLNLGIDADTYRAFVNWTNGQAWDFQYTEAIQRVVDRYGYNVEFVRDAVLDTDFYIPRLARDRMAESLARATYRPTATVTGGDAFNILYRYMKKRMTRGSFFLRQRYFMMNTVDHFMQMALTAGFGVAAASVSRVLMQDVMVLPFWQQFVDFVARRLPGGQRIPENVLERFRRQLQVYGDKAANNVATIFSVGKYRIEVNPILEGLDGGFQAGGKVYAYRQIRDIAVQEGVFSAFDTSQLASVIEREGALFAAPTLRGASATGTAGGGIIPAGLRNFMADWEKTVSETAEAWGERERLGAMITLMEAGHDPRTAARITIDALYDYSQSMTKADRSMLVGILFPFWAFQKNANAQVFNNIFSPWGAYRLMVLKRARERGAELLTEVLYNDIGGEYGLDVKSMPPELQDNYYAIVTAFEDSYKGQEPPEDAKRALKMLFTGRGRLIEEGKLAMLSPELKRLRDIGAFADLQSFAEYTALRPSASGRQTYLRDRTGVAMLFPRTKAVQMYYRLAGDDHSYMEMFIPESSIEAGMRHHTQLAATYLLLSASALDLLPGIDLKSQGLEEVKALNVLKPIADPARSPILAPILSGTAAGELAAPKRVSTKLAETAALVTQVHPFIGKMMDDMYGTTFVRVPAIRDPFAADVDGNFIELTDKAAAEIRELQKEFPDAAVLRDERYYLPGGVWTTLLENSPLGELNSLLLRYEKNPLERNDIRGEIMRWARGAAGVDVELISPQKTVKREEPKKLKETPGTR